MSKCLSSRHELQQRKRETKKKPIKSTIKTSGAGLQKRRSKNGRGPSKNGMDRLKKFQCAECPKTYKTDLSLRTHVRKCHPQGDSWVVGDELKLKMFNCILCSHLQYCSNDRITEKHVKANHSENSHWKNGLTLMELNKLSNISENYIYRFSKGDEPVSDEYHKLLAEATRRRALNMEVRVKRGLKTVFPAPSRKRKLKKVLGKRKARSEIDMQQHLKKTAKVLEPSFNIGIPEKDSLTGILDFTIEEVATPDFFASAEKKSASIPDIGFKEEALAFPLFDETYLEQSDEIFEPFDFRSFIANEF